MTVLEAPERARLRGVDRVRGAAVLLMVLDHALVLSGAGGFALLARLTVTRASLPLFCVVAGCLSAGRPRARRLVPLIVAGVVLSVLELPFGTGVPDVLLVLAAMLCCLPRAGSRAVPVVLAVAVVQPVTWPVGTGGYEPGVVLGLLIVGQLLGRAWVDRVGVRLPSALEVVGRYPLTWYVAHLAVLAGVWLWL